MATAVRGGYLRSTPCAVLVRIDEDETVSGLGPGIIAVETVTSQPFTVEVELED